MSEDSTGEKMRFYSQNLLPCTVGIYFVHNFLSVFIFWASTSTKYHFFPTCLESLGVLPIKFRGGLGQRPETLHQVPIGSEVTVPLLKVQVPQGST